MISDRIRQINSVSPQKIITLRNSVDRYGFSHMIAREMKLYRVPRSFANWQHGWIWWDDATAEELGFDKRLTSVSCIVSDNNQVTTLINAGLKEVRAGGLPFAYTKSSGIKRLPGTLIAMLPHSAEAEKITKSHSQYLDFLMAQANDFDQIAVCVYHLDWSSDLEDQISRRRMTAVRGARPDEAASLQRMRDIFDSFEYCTTNTMGSHIAYALYCGCKVSISGPLYEYDASDFGASDRRGDEEIARYLMYHSRYYIMRRYPWLQVSLPKYGVCNEVLGREFVGSERRMTLVEVGKALKWGPLDQLVGYTHAIFRKAQRSYAAFR